MSGSVAAAGLQSVRSAWSGLLLGLLILLPTGCAVAPRAPAPMVSETLLDQALEAQQRQFSSLRGMADVRIEDFSGSRRSTQLILAEKPDRFRAEVLSMFGQPWLSMASDGTTLGVSLPSRRQFFQGDPSAENLQRFIRLPLEVRDLVHLLLHEVPMIDARQRRSIAGPRLVLTGPGGEQHLEFDGRLRLVAATYLDQASEPWMRVRYAAFSPGHEDFPLRIEIELPGSSTRVEVELSELEINPVLDDALFRLTVPAGSDVKPLP